MKDYYLIFFGLIILNTFSHQVHAQKFQVSGTEILDPQGNIFLIKGTNVNGPHWPWPRSTVADVNLITENWKFNTIRVNAFPRLADIFPDNNTDLDAIVNEFTSRKVVTILENHDFTGKYPDQQELDALKEWWRDLAERFKDNTYVWFNIANEPGPATDPGLAEWKSFHDEVVKVIRNEVMAENIIVLDGNAYGQENGYRDPSTSAIHTQGLYFVQNYANITFSLHLYNSWIYGKERLVKYIEDAKSKGLSMHIGEYGSGENYSKGVARDMFEVVIPNAIGRIVWQWDGEDTHKLTNDSGGWAIDKTNGEKPGNLSFVGNLVWKDNRNQLSTGSSDFNLKPPWILNGSFEADDNQWITFGNQGLEQSATDVLAGNQSFKVESGDDGGAVQPLYLITDTTHTLSAWGKASSASPAGNIGIQYKVPPDGDQIQHILRFDENVFRHKSVDFRLPKDVFELSVFIYRARNGGVFYADKINIVITGTVTDNESVKENLNPFVYPNPVSQKLYIRLHDSGSHQLKLFITTTLGKVFTPGYIVSKSGLIEVNTANLPAGMFILNIKQNDEVLIKKLFLKDR